MIRKGFKGLGAGFMLATLLAAFAAFSQEANTDDSAAAPAEELEELGPAVDTSAVEREEIDPGVPSAVLARDVRRTQSGSDVMDRIDLGRTEITGNQELPKVLYIVPWQKADPGDLMGKPVNTLLDEVLAPIDREEFVRQVDYYDDLNGSDED